MRTFPDHFRNMRMVRGIESWTGKTAEVATAIASKARKRLVNTTAIDADKTHVG